MDGADVDEPLPYFCECGPSGPADEPEEHTYMRITGGDWGMIVIAQPCPEVGRGKRKGIVCWDVGER